MNNHSMEGLWTFAGSRKDFDLPQCLYISIVCILAKSIRVLHLANPRYKGDFHTIDRKIFFL